MNAREFGVVRLAIVWKCVNRKQPPYQEGIRVGHMTGTVLNYSRDNSPHPGKSKTRYPPPPHDFQWKGCTVVFIRETCYTAVKRRQAVVRREGGGGGEHGKDAHAAHAAARRGVRAKGARGPPLRRRRHRRGRCECTLAVRRPQEERVRYPAGRTGP